MRRLYPLVVSLAGLVLLVGCRGDITSDTRLMSPDGTMSSNQASQASIVLSPHSPNPLLVGATATLTATGHNYVGGAMTVPVTWVSRDTGIVTVNSGGIVSARSLGVTFVVASWEQFSDSVAITVLPVPVYSVSVSLSPSVSIGASAQATAQALDSVGGPLSGRPVTWSSQSPSVAFVSGTGLVTGVGMGTALITATIGGVTGSATVSILGSVTTIAVRLPLASVPAFTTTQATAILRDSLGNVLTGYPVAWASSNWGVAIVSPTGLVAAISAGTAVITAVSNGKTGSATVTGGSGPAFVETPATLPAVYHTTPAPPAPAAGGVVIPVPAGGNLQAALNAANPGDVIALANGAIFTGNFTLPNKQTASTNWITIRPQTLTALPAEGARMTPSIAAAANLPTIQTPNSFAALATALAAHHYRLTGIEVTLAPSVVANYGLIRLGEDGSNGQTTLASVAHDLVLDRVYVHGSATQAERRCVTLNSAASAIIDSYISDCHEATNDAQAIAGWNGPGPFKIVNNYLEASTENVAFGGVDPGIPNLVPSDIEIRGNHFFKPAAWKGVWLVKNLFELKNAQRVLVEGNIFQHNWLDGQGGSAINLKSTNQSGGCPWCGTRDVTFRLNLIDETGAGFNLSGAPDPNVTNFHLQRITITDNVVQNIDASPTFNGDGRGFLINQDITDVIIAHNTVMSPTTMAIGFGGPLTQPAVRLSLRDNIIGGGAYGVKGPGLTSGTVTLLALAPGGTFLDNVVIQQSGGGYPGANFFPSANAAVGFINAAARNFQLTLSSPYRNMASNGSDPGADVSAVKAAVQGVIVP